VQNWLFETGHPSLLYPDQAPEKLSLDTVLISWDCSRAASRAVADALPILKRAKQVKVITVSGEKDLPAEDTKTPLLEYLAAHEVNAQFDIVKIGGRHIGEVLLAEAASVRADLIVMGAFGHSRMREFFLGGATSGVLEKAKLPILMSH
ncbi:MAG: universal stress protein, partial [Alphaproteobacteria bacterium]